MSRIEQPQLAEHWPVGHDEYHADHTAIGSTMLREFAKSRANFHGRYIAGTLPPKPPTPAMRLGTLVHQLILQPEIDPLVLPDFDWRSKAGKLEFVAWAAHQHGVNVPTTATLKDDMLACVAHLPFVDPEMLEQARAMAAAVLRSKVAGRLLGAPGRSEFAIRWQDPGTALMCKAMFDKIIDGHHIVVDIKTTEDASPRSFASTCARYQYDWQAVWYRAGYRQLTGALPRFVFVMVEKQGLHEVGCHELTDADIERAEREVAQQVVDLADCLSDDNEDTAFVTPWTEAVNITPLPRWRNYNDYEPEDEEE